MKWNIKYELANCKYFSLLSDGSTDSSMKEEELVYLLYLRNGKPNVIFSSIKPTENANTEGLYKCIKKTFERYDTYNFQNRLVGLNYTMGLVHS